MKTKILIIALLLGFQMAFSQACGGGKLVINLAFEKENQPTQYEIFKVGKEEYLKETFAIAISKETLHHLGKIEKLTKENSSGLIKMNLDKEIENNMLIFQTVELFNKPFLLKFSNDKKEYYYFGCFFCGCGGEIRLSEQNTLILRIK